MAQEPKENTSNNLCSNVIVPVVSNYSQPHVSPVGRSIRTMEQTLKNNCQTNSYFEEILSSLDLEFLLREILNKRLRTEDKFTQTDNSAKSPMSFSNLSNISPVTLFSF